MAASRIDFGQVNVLSSYRRSQRSTRDTEPPPGRASKWSATFDQRARRQAGDAVGRDSPGDAPVPGSDGELTAFVDTNVLVRHLTGDPPDQAARATRFLPP